MQSNRNVICLSYANACMFYFSSLSFWFI